ncbi:hypothetical protein EON80_03490 [bacterium]|nr:MAG: hypothetical protein EON80_03490 [bacterium]
MENGKGWMGKRVVNEEEFFTQIQRLRSALPKSMKDAEDLMKKAEAVVKSAQGEADRLIDGAEREAERVITDARTRSERTVNEAKAHADRLTEETKARTDRSIEDATNKAQKTIEEANERAHRIEEEARKRADEMVSEHEVTIRAGEEADATRLAASNEAEDMRQNADDYAFEVLDKVSGVLDKLSVSVKAGKDALRTPAGNFSNGEYGNEVLSGNFNNGLHV